jgi:zinc transporter 13
LKEQKQSMNVKESTKSKKIDITGYLNLLANGFDNLTHGLAVGASFLVSFKMGLLTTFAIVIHEIPHEIGDFAILIKSGFSKWEAVKAQVSIASVTILGSIIILCADSADVVGIKTAWILPFTSGGFLHIALVSILPELLNEPNLHQSLKQAFFIASGITVMAFVNLIGE